MGYLWWFIERYVIEISWKKEVGLIPFNKSNNFGKWWADEWRRNKIPCDWNNNKYDKTKIRNLSIIIFIVSIYAL